LHGSDIVHPFHGVHHERATVVDPIAAYRMRLRPGQFFSHETAAQLYGIPLPYGPSAVHVAVYEPRTPPRARGAAGHRLSAHVQTRILVGGEPVCSPADVWCQLAATLSADDLVAAGDHLLGARRRDALADLGELSAASERHGATRGARIRIWALERLRWGSDSRPESLLRLLCERLGMHDLRVNEPLEVSGRRLHPDLLAPAFGLILEYEGDHHRVDRDQWNRDIERHAAFADAGYRVLRVTARDLFVDPAGLARKVRKASNRAP
jgi:very-short-patch-repair endonuclease